MPPGQHEKVRVIRKGKRDWDVLIVFCVALWVLDVLLLVIAVRPLLWPPRCPTYPFEPTSHIIVEWEKKYREEGAVLTVYSVYLNGSGDVSIINREAAVINNIWMALYRDSDTNFSEDLYRITNLSEGEWVDFPFIECYMYNIVFEDEKPVGVLSQGDRIIFPPPYPHSDLLVWIYGYSYEGNWSLAASPLSIYL